MTREWQEATNRRFQELGIEPISGPGSEGYKVPASLLSDSVLRDLGLRRDSRRFRQPEESSCRTEGRAG